MASKIVSCKFEINEYSSVTIFRTKDARLISIFNLTYGHSRYNRKLIIKTEEALRLIEELKNYRSIIYPSCEVVLSDSEEYTAKLIIHPSTYELREVSATFGVWYKQTRNSHPVATFTFTLYNRHEIDQLIRHYESIETLYHKQSELNIKIEKIYDFLASNIDRSDNAEVSLRRIDSTEFGKKYNVDIEAINYIKSKCIADFVSFMEATHGVEHSNNDPASTGCDIAS